MGKRLRPNNVDEKEAYDDRDKEALAIIGMAILHAQVAQRVSSSCYCYCQCSRAFRCFHASKYPIQVLLGRAY